MPCQEEQELWCIFRGDSVTYSFLFWDTDTDTPIDITDMELWLTFKLKAKDTDVDAGLQIKVTFPDNIDSQNGLGHMKLESTDTDPLIPNKSYFYDFQLVNPLVVPADVTTMGSGKVPIKQDITQVTA